MTANTLALIPMLPQVGPTELIIILTIVLLLFGAKKIPELAKGLGTGVREFKRGTSGADEKELPQGGANQHEKVRTESDDVRAGQKV